MRGNARPARTCAMQSSDRNPRCQACPVPKSTSRRASSERHLEGLLVRALRLVVLDNIVAQRCRGWCARRSGATRSLRLYGIRQPPSGCAAVSADWRPAPHGGCSVRPRRPNGDGGRRGRQPDGKLRSRSAIERLQPHPKRYIIAMRVSQLGAVRTPRATLDTTGLFPRRPLIDARYHQRRIMEHGIGAGHVGRQQPGAIEDELQDGSDQAPPQLKTVSGRPRCRRFRRDHDHRNRCHDLPEFAARVRDTRSSRQIALIVVQNKIIASAGKHCWTGTGKRSDGCALVRAVLNIYIDIPRGAI